MTEPIADVKESAGRGKLIACGDVAVREDEVFDIGGLQQLAGKLHLELIFTMKTQHTLVMGVTTNPRTEPRDGEGLPRVQHTVKPPIEPIVQDSLDQQVLALFAA